MRVPLVLATVVTALLVSPAAASATVACEYSSGVLTVELTGNNAHVTLDVSPVGAITVAEQTFVTCTGPSAPTVTNTSAISVVNQMGTQGTFVDVRSAGRFAPGAAATDEGGGTPEIEIFVNLKDDPVSALYVVGADQGSSVRFGADGVNPNATEGESVPDEDVFPISVVDLIGVGGPGPDTFGAQGGAGTGGPLTDGILLLGSASADILTGGEGPDSLRGESGDDRLFGMGGDDSLDSSVGLDTLDGGAGQDTADYRMLPAGVSVDLAVPGPQSKAQYGSDTLAAIENVAGGSGEDVLRGDDRPNVLSSGQGRDELEGRGGDDRLNSGEGKDELDVRDGGPDRADCGNDADTVTADAPGVDALLGCETVAFPVMGGGGGGGTTTGPDADTVAPSFLGPVKAVPRRLRRRTTLRYALSEPAIVTITVQRRRRGRYRRVARLTAAAAAGANQQRLSRRLVGRVLAPGAYRGLLRAVDAAGNASSLATARFTVPGRRHA